MIQSINQSIVSLHDGAISKLSVYDQPPAVQSDYNYPTVAICFRVCTPGYRFLHLSSTPCHTRDYR